MTIPFLHLFKRKPVTEHSVVVAPPPLEKPSSERLSKTVLPNSIHISGKDDSPRGHGSATSENGNSGAGSRVSFSVNGGGLPPAVALALEPKVERAISLDLADVIAQMPEGLTRPLHERDAKRRVLLKAAEIEKGMASAKPTVSISTIYEQVPEIFLHPVVGSDTTQVQLPFEKVLEQFSKLQLRTDQYREQNVPQVETPFLQVTLEDNTRFGITMEPIQTGDLPPVRLEPATAASIADFEPEAAAREKFSLAPPRGTPLRPSAAKQKPLSPPPASPNPPPTAPARIAFKLTPNGMDAPATERVPASTGPSVPTSSPAPSAPTRIPFKMGVPKEEPPADAQPWITKENLDAQPPTPVEETFAPSLEAKGSGTIKISLPLKPILQSLPPFQLTGDIAGISDDARLELPFSLVEPQLVTGRVVLKPEEFAAALSPEHRGLFSAKEISAPVALSLQDVLKNLPVASLRIREDQQEEEKGADFATPFSAKAEEDARRFNGVTAPSSTPVATPAIAPTPEPQAVVTEAVEPAEPTLPLVEPLEPKIAEPPPAPSAAPSAGRTPLQEIFETDDELDAKAVAARIDQMAGVKACAFIFADGLPLAGSLPAEFEADGLCAMAPMLMQRLENHLVETKLGDLRAMTLSCAQAATTFFLHGNLCLAALHTGELDAAVRERLSRTVSELSQKYSHPA